MKPRTHLIFIIFTCLILFFATSAESRTKIRVDQTGRTIELPDSPKRVVSLAPSITEIIYDLKCQDLLKGVTLYSDYPEQAQSLPKVGSYVYLDLEKIVSLKPDLCIGIKDGNPKEIVLRLESMGIPVYAVNPRNLSTIQKTIMEIGDLLNARKQADNLVAEMRSRINRVSEITARADHLPKVFLQIGIAPIVSAGADTFLHEMIVTAGGTNVAEKYKSYPRFSIEEVVVSEPDIIVITSMARQDVFDQVKAQWAQWPGLPAVKNNRIFLVNSDLFDRPTPRLLDGLEILVELIHPELIRK